MQNSQNKRRTGRAGIIVAAVLIILVGAGLMLYPKMTDLRYAWAQWRLGGDVAAAQADPPAGATETAADPASGNGVALPDEAVALLKIPAIDFQAYVLEGTNRSTLAKGPGHYPDTPLPGEGGNSAIAGHRTMYGHPFGDLDLLQPGDEIIVATAACTAVYRVVRTLVVRPTETDVIAQTGVDRLTLTTCHPKGSAARRLVVVAERTE
jgi:sortase A